MIMTTRMMRINDPAPSLTFPLNCLVRLEAYAALHDMFRVVDKDASEPDGISIPLCFS
jgi:hypothetical protein